jgi:DNA-binding transcriptional MocR family regulator
LEAHHLWPTLPERWRQAELNLHARQSGIALVPSEAFAVGPAPGAFRVSLGAAQTGPCWNAASASLYGAVAWTQRPVFDRVTA